MSSIPSQPGRQPLAGLQPPLPALLRMVTRLRGAPGQRQVQLAAATSGYPAAVLCLAAPTGLRFQPPLEKEKAVVPVPVLVSSRWAPLQRWERATSFRLPLAVAGAVAVAACNRQQQGKEGHRWHLLGEEDDLPLPLPLLQRVLVAAWSWRRCLVVTEASLLERHGCVTRLLRLRQQRQHPTNP